MEPVKGLGPKLFRCVSVTAVGTPQILEYPIVDEGPFAASIVVEGRTKTVLLRHYDGKAVPDRFAAPTIEEAISDYCARLRRDAYKAIGKARDDLERLHWAGALSKEEYATLDATLAAVRIGGAA